MLRLALHRVARFDDLPNDDANGEIGVSRRAESVGAITKDVQALLSNEPAKRETPTGYVSRVAMRLIAGWPLNTPNRSSHHQPNLLGLAWVAYAKQDLEEARRLLKEAEPLIEAEPSGSMTPFIKQLWFAALTALLDGRTSEATKFWRRALEVCSLFKPAITPMIEWTFVAHVVTSNREASLRAHRTTPHPQ